VDASVTEEATLTAALYGPESEGTADWDAYMWGWTGDPDPMSLLSLFTTDQIPPGTNDVFYSNPRYDELFKLQQRAIDDAERHGYIAEMQNLFYDDSPNIVMYYDNELHAYRTDKFGGWTNQPPASGTPIFGYGYPGYLALTDATAATPAPPTEAPTAAPSGSAATPAASASPTPVDGGTTASDNSMLLLVGGLALVVIVVVAGLVLARRGRSGREDDE
jgi:hypothetical protein